MRMVSAHVHIDTSDAVALVRLVDDGRRRAQREGSLTDHDRRLLDMLDVLAGMNVSASNAATAARPNGDVFIDLNHLEY